MKNYFIHYFLIFFVLMNAINVHAQTKPGSKYKAAKDYIKEKEETDPNMTRFPGDRTIKFDNKVTTVETAKDSCKKTCCSPMKKSGKTKAKRKVKPKR